MTRKKLVKRLGTKCYTYPGFFESLHRPWNFLGGGPFIPEPAAWGPPPAATFGEGVALRASSGCPLVGFFGLERAADPFSQGDFGVEAAPVVGLVDPPAGFSNGGSAT